MIWPGNSRGVKIFRTVAGFPCQRAAHTLGNKLNRPMVFIEVPSRATSVYRKTIPEIPWSPKQKGDRAQVDNLLKRGYKTHELLLSYFRNKLNPETQIKSCQKHFRSLIKTDFANSHELVLRDKRTKKVIYATNNDSYFIYIGYLSRFKDVRNLQKFIALLLDEKNPLAIDLGIVNENGYTNTKMRKKLLGNFQWPIQKRNGPTGIGSKRKELLGTIFKFSEEALKPQTVSLTLDSTEKLQFVFRPLEVPLADIKKFSIQDLIMKGKSINVITICRALLLHKYKLQPKRLGSISKFRHTVLSRFHKELRKRNLYFLKMIVSVTSEGKTIDYQIKHGAFFMYTALMDLKEKGSGMKTILEVLSRSHDKVLHFDRYGFCVEHGNEVDSALLKEINNSLPPSKAVLNKAILSSDNTPTLFVRDGQCVRLPSLPRELGNAEFSLITRHLLHLNLNESLEKDKEIAFLLDFIGDRILFYEFMEYSSKNQLPTHLSIINSNVVLSRLSQLYDLQRLVRPAQKYEEAELSPLKKREQNGDLFERVIALVYLACPNACSEWLFRIFETFRLFYETQLYTEKLQDVCGETTGSKELEIKVHSPGDVDFIQIFMSRESYLRYMSAKEEEYKLQKEVDDMKKNIEIAKEKSNPNNEKNNETFEKHNYDGRIEERKALTEPDHTKYSEMDSFLRGIRERVAEKKVEI